MDCIVARCTVAPRCGVVPQFVVLLSTVAPPYYVNIICEFKVPKKLPWIVWVSELSHCEKLREMKLWRSDSRLEDHRSKILVVLVTYGRVFLQFFGSEFSKIVQLLIVCVGRSYLVLSVLLLPGVQFSIIITVTKKMWTANNFWGNCSGKQFFVSKNIFSKLKFVTIDENNFSGKQFFGETISRGNNNNFSKSVFGQTSTSFW